jgi:hypothetical protein
MKKSEVLDWVEYAGKIVTWLSGVVRDFPVMEKKNAVKKSSDSSDKSEFRPD